MKDHLKNAGLIVAVILLMFLLLFIIPENKVESNTCDSGTVLEEIKYSVRIDSLTTQLMRDYRIECNDGSVIRVNTEHNLPIDAYVELQWRLAQKPQ